MKCIRRANHSDKEHINKLRITEFGRSKEFDLLLADQLVWNQCDVTHIVLAAWKDRRTAVSTMRAVTINNSAEARECLQCSLPKRLDFPAIIFNSAATSKAFRGQGLNQAIRYHFLMAALRCGIRAVLSPIYRGAPRIEFMAALGYQFITPERSWQTKLLPKKDRILGILKRSKMGQAIDYLKSQRGGVIDAYPWRGPQFDYPINAPTHKPSQRRAVG